MPHEWLRKNVDVDARQLVALPGDLDPALARADELVGGPLAEQTAVEAGDLDRVLVRQDGAVADDVARDAVVVLLEHQPELLHRRDDLDAQRSDAVVVEVGAQPSRQADVVLAALVTQADEPVEHVVVLVETDVRGETDVALGVAQADVVAVVPLRVAALYRGERVGDLVQGVFVEAGEHGVRSDQLTCHRLQMCVQMTVVPRCEE